MDQNQKPPSNNFCVVCGRYTSYTVRRTLYKIVYDDYFFSCNYCQKVWCVNDMAERVGMSPEKIYKLGKKNQMICQDCGNELKMLKLPMNLPFKQVRYIGVEAIDSGTQINLGQENLKKICSNCGQSINQAAGFCEFCGAQQ